MISLWLQLTLDLITSYHNPSALWRVMIQETIYNSHFAQQCHCSEEILTRTAIMCPSLHTVQSFWAFCWVIPGKWKWLVGSLLTLQLLLIRDKITDVKEPFLCQVWPWANRFSWQIWISNRLLQTIQIDKNAGSCWQMKVWNEVCGNVWTWLY